MLQYHSLIVRKTCDTCDTCEKMSNIYQVYYSFPVSIPVNHSDTCDTRDTCYTCEKMSYISLSLLLYSCLGGLFHILQMQKKRLKLLKKRLKLLQKISQNIAQKNAIAIFFGNLKKHVIPAVRYIPRFRYLRAGLNSFIFR